jgi:hypothetical protein
MSVLITLRRDGFSSRRSVMSTLESLALIDSPVHNRTLRDVPREFKGVRFGDRYGVVFSEFDLSCALETVLNRPLQAGSGFPDFGRVGDDPVHHVRQHVAIVAGNAHPSNQALVDGEFAEHGADFVIHGYL